MDFPKRTSLLERARATVDRLRGTEPQAQAPRPPEPQQPARENGEAARMAAALREGVAAAAPARVPVTPAENTKAVGELTPSHTPGHVPQNFNQWQARSEAQAMATRADRLAEQATSDKAGRPPVQTKAAEKEQDR